MIGRTIGCFSAFVKFVSGGVRSQYFLQDEFYPLIINLESTCLFIVRSLAPVLGFAGLFRQAENTSPEAPSEEQPTPKPEKPEFVDKNTTMEENIGEEYPDCYYTYFRMQNASQENAIFFISTKMSASGDMIRIAPGEQGTWGQMMEKMLWIDDNDVLVKNLDALGFVQLYFNVPPITEDNYHAITPDVDTCAQYSFFDPMTESQRGTPRDQSAWVLEEFPDRPNAVRWTYRITDKDYKEAVRQTLERWADRDEE